MNNSNPTTILGKIPASAARHLAAVALLLAITSALFPHSAWAQAPTLTKLHDFTKLDGSYPTSGLLRASDGNAEVFLNSMSVLAALLHMLQ
jgi:hypothetical protein